MPDFFKACPESRCSRESDPRLFLETVCPFPGGGMSVSVATAISRDNHRHGIYWMMLTMFMFVSMDSMAKYLTESYAVAQVVWARYLFHVVLLFIWLGPRLPATLKTKRLGLQLVCQPLGELPSHGPCCCC